MAKIDLNGCHIHTGFLDRGAQEQMRDAVRDIARAAPFFSPLTPWGKPMSVKMTAAGKYGWFTDRKGYRYIDTQPNGGAWPAIPAPVLDVWRNLVGATRMPDCCLVNFYATTAKMGLHQDKDEADFSWPVLSISLGDTALFRVGGQNRKDPTQSIDLQSGDVALLSGPARLAFHGIDRVRPGTSTLLRDGGRINLTLRVVD